MAGQPCKACFRFIIRSLTTCTLYKHSYLVVAHKPFLHYQRDFKNSWEWKLWLESSYYVAWLMFCLKNSQWDNLRTYYPQSWSSTAQVSPAWEWAGAAGCQYIYLTTFGLCCCSCWCACFIFHKFVPLPSGTRWWFGPEDSEAHHLEEWRRHETAL